MTIKLDVYESVFTVWVLESVEKKKFRNIVHHNDINLFIAIIALGVLIFFIIIINLS